MPAALTAIIVVTESVSAAAAIAFSQMSVAGDLPRQIITFEFAAEIISAMCSASSIGFIGLEMPAA